jgi:septum site-determining protein MinC
LAYSLTPRPPIADWLAELDKWARNSPGFFVGRPIVLDLAAVTLSNGAFTQLIGELSQRQIRIIGIESAEPYDFGPDLPPSSAAAQPAARRFPALHPAIVSRAGLTAAGTGAFRPVGDLSASDVTVVGQSRPARKSSPADRSIYGALRGRALAGSMGISRPHLLPQE